jgi:thiosulfate dehydrogenase (quinone) large subunit
VQLVSCKVLLQKPVLVAHSTVLEYPNYVAFLKSFAIPNVGLFNFLVPWGELFVGIGLITGTLTTAAVFFGMMMNFAYMFAGTISSNPWDVLIGLFIIVAGYNAGKFGGDYWVIPWVRQHVTSWLHHEIGIGSGTGGKAVH